MSASLAPTPVPEPAGADCWNRIGVRGDSSCAQLERHVHCRNCPVYTATAAHLLEGEPPTDYLAHWTHQVARPSAPVQQSALSALIVRVGAEWLALPTRVVDEIATTRPVHSIPQRSDGIVLGLTSIRGELLVCVSLHRIVGLEGGDSEEFAKEGKAAARLLVLRQDGRRIVCRVDQIHGIERHGLHELQAPPATLGKSAACFTRAVLTWDGRTVGLIDEERLFDHINRNLA
jgi:chemotaxis-related protein WspD